MIIILLIIIILVAILPLSKNAIFSTNMDRISSITIIFISFLTMNILNFERLNTGLSIFSGFFSVSVINLTFLILILLTGGLILAVLSSNRYILKNKNQLIFLPLHPFFNNYCLIILFNLLGACSLISANDILSFYIAIETQSFSLYLLSALQNDSVNSARAGLKYFLIGSLASIFILLGLGLIYYSTGLTNFEQLYIYLNITDYFSAGAYGGGILEGSPFYQEMHFWNFAEWNHYYFIIIFAFVLILSGLLIKSGAAPFHQWAPDVYSSVSTTVTTWLVILPKISILILIYQILELILNTGNSNSYGNIATEVYNLIENEDLNLTFQQFPDFISYIEDITTLNILYKLLEVYNEATFFYPHYLQLELTNLYNSPIINETEFFKYEDALNEIWANFKSFYHNSLIYNINISQIGSLSIKNFLIIISIISLLIGSIGGLVQTKIKRLLAFSSIGQIGFIILALAINTKIGLESFIFYLLQYTLINLNIFLIIIGFGYLVYTYPLNNKIIFNSFTEHTKESKSKVIFFSGLEKSWLVPDINFINQLKGMFKQNPILTLSFILALFSMVGVPPLPGFFAKQQVLLAAISLGFIFISLIAINTSVISAFYYLQLINLSTKREKTHFNFITNNDQIKNSEVLTIESFSNNNIDLKIKQTNINNFIIKLPNIFSYSISILTLSILFFILKADMCFNFISILTSYLYNL